MFMHIFVYNYFLPKFLIYILTIIYIFKYILNFHYRITYKYLSIGY